MTRSLAFVAAFVLALVVASFAGRPPATKPADIAATEFSAIRAMVDVEAIAQRPHPIGSEDILRVRHYLRERLTTLGLEVIPDFEKQPVYIPSRVARTLVTARVHNVVAVLKGTAPELPAILLMSHYDTVANSAGAPDDTAGVAATLEVIANLKASGPLKRDVIVLFTEGEEAGLLGARAFFTEDALMKRVGLVLNLESRGGGGRAMMFETSERAGGLIATYGEVVGSPAANSLSAFIYRVMPNGTDFTNALNADIPGLNFAFIADEYAYHSASATPANLDTGSVQHMGDQVLAITRALANADDLKAHAQDVIYADLFGIAFVSYPQAAGWALIGVLAVLLGYTFVKARSRSLLRPAALGIGIAYLLCFTLITGLILYVAKGAFAGAFDVQFKYALIGRYSFFLGGCVLLSVALAVGLATLLRQRMTMWNTWLGGLGLLFIISVALQIFAPGTTMFFAWPLLPLAIGAALVMGISGGNVDSGIGLVIATIAAFISAALLAASGAAIFLGLGGLLPSIIALPALLIAIALYPGIDAVSRLPRVFAGALALLAASFAMLGWAAFGPASVAHPRLTQAYYLAGPGADDYAYVSSLPRLDDWSRAVLTADGGTPEMGELTPGYRQPAWRAVARPAAVARPVLSGDARDGRVSLKIVPGGNAREMRFILKSSTPVSDFRIDGKASPFTVHAGEWAQFLYAAPPAGGFSVSFVTPAKGDLSLRVFEVSDGWPDGITVPPKPVGLTPWGMSDTTYAASAFDYMWSAPQ